jgi:hypothetical protein
MGRLITIIKRQLLPLVFYSEVSMKRIALFSVSFLVLRPMPTILLLTVPALFIQEMKKK